MELMPEDRAYSLMKNTLPEKEFRRYLLKGYVFVRGSLGGLYCLVKKPTYNICELTGSRRYLCAVPELSVSDIFYRTMIPMTDIITAQYLFIKNSERKFLDIANVNNQNASGNVIRSRLYRQPVQVGIDMGSELVRQRYQEISRYYSADMHITYNWNPMSRRFYGTANERMGGREEDLSRVSDRIIASLRNVYAMESFARANNRIPADIVRLVDRHVREQDIRAVLTMLAKAILDYGDIVHHTYEIRRENHFGIFSFGRMIYRTEFVITTYHANSEEPYIIVSPLYEDTRIDI